MRSERASRVCIVVLEEVEEDEPSPSSSFSSAPPPRYQQSSTSERRSPHGLPKAATHQDKVRQNVWERCSSVTCVAFYS